MNPEKAPTGSVAVSGHFANGVTFTMQKDGRWRLNIPPFTDLDKNDDYDLIHKGLTLIHNPEEHRR